MSTTSKILWILGLMCVFLFVLATGSSNVRNFEKVQKSIEEIYEDRLVVKGFIFDLATLLHRKEIANTAKDSSFYTRTNDSINAQLDEIIREFRATKLTSYEEEMLDRFSLGVQELKAVEKEYKLANGFNLKKMEEKRLSDRIQSLHEDLKTLSGIQLSEGRRKLKSSGKAVSSMYTFAKVENYMMIIFGALILLIIFVIPGPTTAAKEEK